MHDFRHIAAGEMIPSDFDNPDIRMLRRVSSLENFPLAPRSDAPIRRVAVIDCETTGTDAAIDEVIDIAVVILEVDEAGEIVGIASVGEALRDPGMPIPAHITRLTGITDDDVSGKTIDLDRLERRLASADVRIAHNARFDLAFVQNLIPGLAGASWACSASDFDWVAAGFDGYKQAHLLMQIGRFNDTHRALADVISLIHLLAHRLPHGGTVLRDLLANAEQETVRIEATGAPFDKRAVLKARGYRWDPRSRVWWAEIAEVDLEEEALWLNREAGVWGTPRQRIITWHERHR